MDKGAAIRGRWETIKVPTIGETIIVPLVETITVSPKAAQVQVAVQWVVQSSDVRRLA